MRTALPRMPEQAADFAHWHKRFTAPPALPVDSGALLREMRADLALAELSLERMEITARMKK